MEADRDYFLGCFCDDGLPEGIYAYVEVSDTGAGMSVETKARIFEPFFTTKFTGRGLGLSAVQGIVRGHKGALRVYSELGRGTTIKVLFPVSGRPVASATRDDDTERFRGKGTILVVDDEESIRTVAKMILEEFGFTVMTAGDGVQALSVYRESGDKVAAVLLDMTMPHMDGEETFRELRRIKADVRVILSSGYSEQDATVQFAGKGLAGFLQKPYRPVQLVEMLKRVLGQA
jgi:CheY-like chemotaxis protein